MEALPTELKSVIFQLSSTAGGILHGIFFFNFFFGTKISGIKITVVSNSCINTELQYNPGKSAKEVILTIVTPQHN